MNPDDKLLEILDKLAEASKAHGLNAEQLETLLTKVGLSTAEGMRQSLKPENSEHSHISATFTEADALKYGGYANKPKLARKTYFCGIEEKEDRLTPAEIEGYNRLTNYREARNGRWKAEIKRNGQEEVLFVSVPCDTLDQRMELRPLTLILHELAGGQSTEDLGSLLRQIEALRGVAVKHGATVNELETVMLQS